MDKILDDQQQDPGLFGFDLILRISLAELLVMVNRYYREHFHISSSMVDSSCHQIYSVMNYIHTHLEGDLSLTALAQSIYVSPRYLSSLFKHVTGTSPGQYVLGCRLMKARDLLVHNIQVDHVCSLVGFSNLSHFSRTFKQHVGVSPKKYAQVNRPYPKSKFTFKESRVRNYR